jgi:hypothetical protein
MIDFNSKLATWDVHMFGVNPKWTRNLWLWRVESWQSERTQGLLTQVLQWCSLDTESTKVTASECGTPNTMRVVVMQGHLAETNALPIQEYHRNFIARWCTRHQWWQWHGYTDGVTCESVLHHPREDNVMWTNLVVTVSTARGELRYFLYALYFKVQNQMYSYFLRRCLHRQTDIVHDVSNQKRTL